MCCNIDRTSIDVKRKVARIYWQRANPLRDKDLPAVNYKAVVQLRENLKGLLVSFKVNQKDLAHAIGRHPTTLNKFLQGTRELQFEDVDQIADFFGLKVYELFQPGGSRLTDRRSGLERRQGKERRIGPAHRMMQTVAADVKKLWQNGHPSHAATDAPSIAAQTALEELVSEFEQRAAPILASAGFRAVAPQAPSDRRAVTPLPAPIRTARRSRPSKAGKA